MAAVDLTGLEMKQLDGQVSVDGTLSNSMITLPDWASEVHVYLDNATAGSFTMTDPSAGRPLPPQTWTRVWIAQRNNPNPARHLWVASASGTVTLHYLVY